MKRKKTVILCIFDGWGLNQKINYPYDASYKASTPNFDFLKTKFPYSELKAYGKDVGLPTGQIGNSEVGHQTIGSGRVSLMNLPKINLDIKNKNFSKNKSLNKLINDVQITGGKIHLIGLISNGGVHGHRNHLITLSNFISNKNVRPIIHGFLDGRDGPLKSAKDDFKILSDELEDDIEISSLSGRYYGMDRDNRWERTKLCFEAIMYGKAKKCLNFLNEIDLSYKNEIFDEFFIPTCIENYNGVDHDKDGILFLNFRTDRALQIFSSLCDPKFNKFNISNRANFTNVTTIVNYSKKYDYFTNVLYKKDNILNTLGEYISKNNMVQMRLSETEKFPHVTFFFNGGRENPFLNEDRCHVPSPSVSTYDFKPEMSADEITKKLKKFVELNKYDFILVNFANPDMVGHTGNFTATVKACEVVDQKLGKILSFIKNKDVILILTSDHGNCEKMFDEKNNMPHTSHTLNKVPFIIVGLKEKVSLKNGSLSDIAPTILYLLNLNKPEDMTGINLII